MPWIVRKRGEQWCVWKEDEEGEPTGESLGCHDSRAEAQAQVRALYASESASGVGPMECKALPAVGTEVDGRTVTGFASVFGVLDSYNDITHRGAFKKTLKEQPSRIRHLWQHDSFSPPVATILEIREVGAKELPDAVMEAYPEATGGLLVKRQYLETARGDEVLAGLQARPPAITELSFGYDPVKFDFTVADEAKGLQVRNLREVKLYDTSDVLWGANPATANAKSLTRLDPRLMQLQTAIAPLLLPDALKVGRMISATNLAKLHDALSAIEAMLTAAEPPTAADETVAKALTEALLVKIDLAERELAFLGV